MVRRWLLALVALWVALPALASQVQLVVPYRTLEVGQQGQVEVVVVNGRPTSVPRLRSEPGLDVRYLSQSRSTRMVNLRRISTVSFNYAVRALQEGEFTIGPAELEVDGQVVRTNAVQVRVQAAAPPPEAVVEAYASTSVASAWEGQVVLYKYGTRSRERIARSAWVALPLSRLSRPREGDAVRRTYVIDDPAGPIWVDETWDPFLITSNEPLSLEPAVVHVEIPVNDPRGRMRLFQPTETKTVATGSVAVHVRPLPPSPPGFTGLVGDFEITGSVARTDAEVGDSLAWTVRVVGSGSLEGFRVPAAPDRADVRFYDGSPTVWAEIEEGGYVARGEFTRVIVPTRPGRLAIDPLEMVTFSPTRGAYVTHTLRVPPIEVGAGKESGGEIQSFAPDDAATPRPEGPVVVDFYPVRGWGRAHSAFIAPWLLGLAGVLVGVGLVPLLLDAAAAWRRSRPVTEAVVEVSPARLLERAEQGGPESLALLDEALREALRRRVAPDAPRVERASALSVLPEALASEVRAVGGALDRARFAGDAPGPDLALRVRTLVGALGEAS